LILTLPNFIGKQSKGAFGERMAISGKELRRLAERAGWVFKRQSGSHMILEKGDKTVSIPNHRELKKGTELSIRKQLDLKIA
jgi:predicted RNA binding protein YcfA (HicA-like mRNA interferase family)